MAAGKLGKNPAELLIKASDAAAGLLDTCRRNWASARYTWSNRFRRCARSVVSMPTSSGSVGFAVSDASRESVIGFVVVAARTRLPIRWA